jgi:hypothetical protein
MTFNNFVKSIQEEIFKRIQEHDPRNQDMYDAMDFGDDMHEELDHAINIEYGKDELLADYGIQKAFDIHVETFGKIGKADNIVGMLLYTAVKEELDICWNEYELWAFKDEERCGCGTYPIEPIICDMCKEVICDECYDEDDNWTVISEKCYEKVYNCGCKCGCNNCGCNEPSEEIVQTEISQIALG